MACAAIVLPDTARAAEERGDAAAVRQLLAEPPGVHDLGRMADVRDDFGELRALIVRQHDVVQLEHGLDTPAEARKLRARPPAGTRSRAPRSARAAAGLRRR